MHAIRKTLQIVTILSLLLASFAIVPAAHATGVTITVDTTIDNPGDGDCSFQEAVRSANGEDVDGNCDPGTAELDTIAFAIGVPPRGAETITLTSVVTVTQPLYIDGTTQGDVSGGPLITIEGTPSTLIQFQEGSDGSTVEGLRLNGVPSGASCCNLAFYSDGNRVIGNYFGIGTDGLSAVASSIKGVNFFSSVNNRVGGSTATERNLFGSRTGIVLLSSSVSSIEGNYFGFQADGITPLAGLSGTGPAIWIYSDADGTTPGPDPASGNSILNNVVGGYSDGIFLESRGTDGSIISQTSITGNYIGMTANGMIARPNYNGITLRGTGGNTIGGTALAARNFIAGNTYANIEIQDYSSNHSDNNLIEGNYIGTDAAGLHALGSTSEGVIVDAAAGNRIFSNVISGHTGGGVYLIGGSSGTILRGNKIGTDKDGLNSIPNGTGVSVYGSSVNIGDAITPGNNLISGNGNPSYYGIHIGGSSSASIYGNLLGVNAAGTAAIPNGTAISLENGAVAQISNNWIANSVYDGVYVGASSAVQSSAANCMTANVRTGVSNMAGPGAALFSHNWWGAATGPTHPSNPSGTGDAVSNDVDYSSFLTSIPTACLQRLTNAGFELDTDSNKKPDGWTVTGFKRSTDRRDCTIRQSGTCSFKLVGNGLTKTATQTIPVAAMPGHKFSYSLWSKSSTVPVGSTYRVQVKFYSGSHVLYARNLNFKSGTHGFRQVKGSLIAPWNCDKVVFKIIFKAISGKAWFDAAELNWSP